MTLTMKRILVQGLAMVAVALATLIWTGCGHKTDLERLREAAEKGDAKAQYKLGSVYYLGKGVPQDYVEGVRWILKAAEQGNAKAQASLGAIFSYGKGVPQDNIASVRWLEKAAEQGLADSQFCLGMAYYAGNGVPQSYPEAVKWFRKAAEQGDPVAQEALGLAYARGEGVPQDFIAAYKWLHLAFEVHIWHNRAGATNKWLTVKNGFSNLNNEITELMPPEQIAEGKKRAAAFVPKKAEPASK
jgi:hypothetical protein